MEKERQVILVVDDDREIVKVLGKLLELEGYEVHAACNGMDALEILTGEKIHLIILDVMMPKLDGLSTLMEIRRRRNIPVIMLSAKTEESDKVLGLSMGADDYVVKPFSLPVLYARAEALVGRVWKSGFGRIRAGELSVDVRSHEVWKRGKPLRLPPKEYEILLFFLENPGRVYSRDQRLIRFWGYDFEGSERVVDSHIRKLRRALGDCGCVIQTVRKTGYRMEVRE